MQLLARNPWRRRRSTTGIVAGRRMAVRAYSAEHVWFTEARHVAEPQETKPFDMYDAFEWISERPWRASISRSSKTRREDGNTRSAVEAVEGQETSFAGSSSS